MKRFTKGFIRNFVTLLLMFSGIRAWQQGLYWLSILCFAVVVAITVLLVIERRKAKQESDGEE